MRISDWSSDVCSSDLPERRGRLVHDEDFGVEQDGAGDGDRLALTAREVLHRVLDVLDVRVEAMQHRARLVLHGIVVEQPERRPQLAAEQEVDRRVELVGQGARLVERLDAVAAGVANGKGDGTVKCVSVTEIRGGRST